jgi:TonB family protein
MATCYRCGGWKSDFGNCNTCETRDTQERQNREIIDSIDNAARIQAKVAALQAVYQAEQAEIQNQRLLELEKKKLAEQKKQTQILLEQTLTEEEVFQRGFNFLAENDEHNDAMEIDTTTGEDLTPDHLNYVAVDLNEQGDFTLNFDNPYVGQKFKKAYKDGIEKKIAQDFPEPPGFDFIRDRAFDEGYAKSEFPSIFYPEIVDKQVSYIERNGSKYAFILQAKKKPNFTEVIQEHTGSLSYTWTPPYETELLNLSFEAGVNKFLDEQNTAEKKHQRLALVKKESEDRKRRIEFVEQKKRKEQSQETIKNITSSTALYTFVGGLIGFGLCLPLWFFILIFADSFWGFAQKMTLYGAGIGAGIGFLRGLSEEQKSINYSEEELNQIEIEEGGQNQILNKSKSKIGAIYFAVFSILSISIFFYYYKNDFGINLSNSQKSVDKEINGKNSNEISRNQRDSTSKSEINDSNNESQKLRDSTNFSEKKLPAPQTSENVINPSPIQTDIGKLVLISIPDADSYYPSFSKRAGEQGEVVVRLIINEAGEVEDARLLQSSSYPRLDRAAIEIGKRYLFKPYLIDGSPAKISTNLLVRFNLKNKDEF